MRRPWYAHEGYIQAEGVEKNVTFFRADYELSDELGAAYHVKYRRCSTHTLVRITIPAARSTSIELIPG